jgi:hypothetical protein
MVKKPRFRGTPEDTIQDRIISFLEDRGWLVEKMHGNAFQKGIPDLYCFNPLLNRPEGLHRWIDVKVKGRYKYTKDQCQKWPKWEEKNLGVWIMVDATEEEYAKLFEAPNFRQYWKPHYDNYLRKIDEILDSEGL